MPGGSPCQTKPSTSVSSICVSVSLPPLPPAPAPSPASSKRDSCTRSATSENRVKFVPHPSHVAPSGYGVPGQIRIRPLHTASQVACGQWPTLPGKRQHGGQLGAGAEGGGDGGRARGERGCADPLGEKARREQVGGDHDAGRPGLQQAGPRRGGGGIGGWGVGRAARNPSGPVLP